MYAVAVTKTPNLYINAIICNKKHTRSDCCCSRGPPEDLPNICFPRQFEFHRFDTMEQMMIQE